MGQKSQITPIISVIVATRNRRESLSQFLEALHALDKRPAWELIVVDNGSTDGTESLLSTAAEELPIVIINESSPGKSRALNRATKCARGDILLFSDDDVVPETNWLSALHQASIDYPDANVFGGRILVNHERIPRWIVNSHNLRTILTSEQDLGNEVRWFADDQYPAGPNLAVRRRSVEREAIFWPVNLGPGTRIPVGDERAFLMQVSEPKSRDRLYIPNSVVRHNVTDRQLDMVSAVSRCFLGGYSAGLMSRAQRRFKANSGEGIVGVALQRFLAASSVQELICVIARALGAAAGTLSPSLPASRG